MVCNARRTALRAKDSNVHATKVRDLSPLVTQSATPSVNQSVAETPFEAPSRGPDLGRTRRDPNVAVYQTTSWLEDTRGPSGHTALTLAAVGGREARVADLIARGVNVNRYVRITGLRRANVSEKWTTLQIAAFYGHAGCLLTLLRAGADCDAKLKSGANALTLASEGGHADCVEVLLQHGAEAGPDNRRWTALHAAAFTGSVACVEALLRSGRCDVNAADAAGVTALMAASKNGHEGCLQLLIDAGAELNRRTTTEAGNTTAAALCEPPRTQGDTVSLLAGMIHADCVAEHLKLRPAGLKALSSAKDWTALLFAAFEGHAGCLLALLRAGADRHAKLWCGANALSLASERGHAECAEALLQHGAEAHPDIVGWTALHAAVRVGSIPCVEALLRSGRCDVNAVDAADVTAVMVASQNGHEGCLRALIDAGAEANQRSKAFNVVAILKGCENPLPDGIEELLKLAAQDIYVAGSANEWTAVLLAALNGHVGCLLGLLRAGADCRAKLKSGTNALSLASERGHADCVAVLLQQGAEVVPNKRGWTALHAAVHVGSIPCVEALLRSGRCTAGTADAAGKTAVMVASERDHEGCLRLLMDAGASLTVRSQVRGTTALMWASASGHLRCVEVILKALEGRVHEVNAVSEEAKTTALVLAARGGHLDCLLALLRAGADIDQRPDPNTSALLSACAEGRTLCVEALLRHNADISASASGQTALHKAAQFGHPECLEMLILSARFDVNATNKNGYTPLMLASKSGHAACLRLFLKSGADLRHSAPCGATALSLACRHGHTSCVKVLLRWRGTQASSSPSTCWQRTLTGGNAAVDLTVALQAACRAVGVKREDTIECVRLLVGAGADINETVPPHRLTPLMIACCVKNPAAVQALLEAKADATLVDSHLSAALHYAAWKGHSECVALLLTFGNVSVNAKQGDGRSALALAAHEGHVDIMRSLITAGANFNPRDVNGSTPLQAASRSGKREAIQLLLDAGANIGLTDEFRQNALHHAARHGQAACVTALLESGLFNVDAVTIDGETACALSSRDDGNLDCLKNCVGSAANLQRLTKRGDSLTQIAATSEASAGCLELVLLTSRAVWPGSTVAAAPGSRAGLRLLRSHGWNGSPIDNGFRLSFDAACNGHTKCVQYLLRDLRREVDRC